MIFAKGIILEAGNKVRHMMKDDLDIEMKSNPNDLVTNVDKATENYLYETIHHNYPEHRVIGEEGHGHNLKDTQGIIWVIDPIDGTLNFVHQKKILRYQLVFTMMVNHTLGSYMM